MTYGSLALVFLGLAALPALVAGLTVGLPVGWCPITAAVAGVLLVLTAVFDTGMIAMDLFRYDPASLIGLRVLLVPIEDFAWPLAAAIALPAIWELLGRSPRLTSESAAHDH
jgi:lycopene cyclase domain-containing protein